MARVYRATIRGHHANGVQFQPGLHYQTDVPIGGDEPNPNDVAAAIWGHLEQPFAFSVPAESHIDEIIVAEEVLKPDIGAGGAHTIDVAGAAGWSSSTTMSHAIVPVINLHTNTRSRSARGWLMMPGPLNHLAMIGDLWDQTTSLWAQLNAVAALLNDTIGVGSVFPTALNPVVYSRTRHQRNTAPWVFPVTGATVNPQVRWLKSRLSSP